MAWWLLAAGTVGLVAAAVLLVERIRLAEDSGYVPSCSINPVLSCGSVMESAQASLLGFPNPVIGVAAFPVVLATGAALLGGAGLARWYWGGLQAGVTLGLVFVGWLIFQSLYRIGALCPYCMVVWAVVLPTFWFVTLRNMRAGVFGHRIVEHRGVAALHAWRAPVLLAAYLVVLTLIGVRFWSYWSRLL
ncbi:MULTISPECIES: vitamin K epoxide reductase family protein [unclassified Nocardioides]|uniref:vitamin K epoxide reductase family protein n=1 Tax=unclassified Nocardioides TaxID=2615069 RepID=UPI0024050FD3|nr:MULTISPECIES: vitamin K epoxide reductase family protein [unclassified Nocardioides]